MTLLQIFFVVSGIVIFLLTLDISRKRKFNALHFVVFFLIGIFLLVFTLFPHILDRLGRIFGLQRGADLLVYMSIIFLIYFSLLLLNKIERTREEVTRLIRELAISSSKKHRIAGKVVFIIAAYNESKVIRETLETILRSGYTNCIVVDDGSRDDTLRIVHSLEHEHSGIIALRHTINRGQGAALETGFEYVRRFGDVEYVVTFDADGQHNIADLEKFLHILDTEPTIDVVLGSRFLRDTNSNIPLKRRIILKLGILFTFIISNIRLSDTHNGYRTFRRRALGDIRITLDGMGHASEIIDIIAERDIPFREVPVTILYTDYSLAKGQRSSNAIAIAVDMIRKKFF